MEELKETTIHTSNDLLHSLNLPQDIKKLTIDQMNTLATELVSTMVNLAKVRSMHVSSNLGVIHLTIALLYCFDPKEDQIVFDIGHQAYIYKMLTGRLDRMNTIKLYGGINGFQSPVESVYDKWSAGHSGTSLSAAIGKYLGVAPANRNNHAVVDVIGDASLANGLSLEALDSDVALHAPMIIVLNDNNMSIAPNVGGLHDALVALEKTTDKKDNIFTELGYEYIGVVDGHDFKALIDALNSAKYIKETKNKSVIVHIKTKKGWGYKPDTDGSYHYCQLDVENKPNLAITGPFIANQLLERSKVKQDFMIVSPSITDMLGLRNLQKAIPDYFVDMGMQEEDAMTIAAGIACMHNYRPILATTSTFVLRTYDQVWHDIARQDLGVTLMLDGADSNTSSGTSHSGLFDLGMFKSITNCIVTTGMTNLQNSKLIDLSIDVNPDQLFAIRYAGFQRNATTQTINDVNALPIQFKQWQILKHDDNDQLCFISYGPTYLSIYDNLKDYQHVSFINAMFITNYDEKWLRWLTSQHFKTIVVYERVNSAGTLGTDIEQYFFENNINIKVIKMNFNGFLFQAPESLSGKMLHMDLDSIKQTINANLDIL